jgi:hypothetical protein
MPRGSFNTTADWFDGPDTLTPGAFRFTGDVRFVAADGITWVDNGIPNVVGWITVGASKPFGGWDSVTQVLRCGLGDTVAVPAGGAQQYFVLVVDEVLWGMQPLYYRAHIANLPRPVPPGPSFRSAKVLIAGNVMTIGALAFGAVVPGMKVYNQVFLGAYVVVTAVAMATITVSAAMPFNIVPDIFYFD